VARKFYFRVKDPWGAWLRFYVATEDEHPALKGQAGCYIPGENLVLLNSRYPGQYVETARHEYGHHILDVMGFYEHARANGRLHQAIELFANGVTRMRPKRPAPTIEEES
jgi:hypothetical protein